MTEKQECTPVGCIPSAAVAVSGGGGLVVCPGGVCLGDVCLRGVCPEGCLPRGVCLGGCLHREEVFAQGGVHLPLL